MERPRLFVKQLAEAIGILRIGFHLAEAVNNDIPEWLGHEGLNPICARRRAEPVAVSSLLRPQAAGHRGSDPLVT